MRLSGTTHLTMNGCLSLGRSVFLFTLVINHLLDGTNLFWLLLLEVLEIQFFNILWQRQFPWFLLMISKPTKLLRVKTKLSCHLDLCVR